MAGDQGTEALVRLEILVVVAQAVRVAMDGKPMLAAIADLVARVLGLESHQPRSGASGAESA